MMVLLAIVLSVLVFFFLLLLLEYIRRGHVVVAQRMRRYAGDGLPAEETVPEPELSPKERLMGFVRRTAKSLKNWRQAERLDLKMLQAGWRMYGSEFLVLVCMGGLLLALLAFLLGMGSFLVLVAFILGPVIGFFSLSIAINRRHKAFVNQLGDTLGMVANALRAGFSFLQAMGLVSTEMEEPMGGEFKKVMTDISLGMTPEIALQNMGKRVESPDFDLMVTAVLIQRRVGGNLAHILDSISGTINDRIRMRREVMTLTAQGRLSGWILVALPVAVGLLLTVISPSYLDPLFDTATGRFFVGYAIVSEIIGFVVIQRIIKIDF